MTEAQSTARHQQRVEELCAAAIRALAGETDLHFRGRRLHRGRQALPIHAAHLAPSLETDDFGSLRGAADGLALRLRNSDASLHRSLIPTDTIERSLFELMEQLRCESLVPAGMAGVVHNLRHRHEQWSLAFHDAGLTDSARGILLYTVVQICRARVTGEPVVEATEDLLELTRGALAPLIGHQLAGLRRDRDDQAVYAVHALAIATLIAEMLRSPDGTSNGADDETTGDDDDKALAAFALLPDPDRTLDDGVASAVSGRSLVLDEADTGYRVFTTAYDSEVNAEQLVRRELLQAHRERLDRRITGQGVNLAHLARDLKALLAVPVRDGWDGGKEEGLIDGRRLALLISSPTERRLFRTEREEPHADCLVSFLLDCSGSMKEHAESVAMLVDIFVRALEQAGVTSEVLGFTTGAWNGGRAQRDWQRAGRPRHPGRLNERCHIVFKSAATPWRRSRSAIAALLEPRLFREGIDGEAVEWAMQRSLARPESRRLLLVVSDGSPMDSATNLANDTHYLDHHLKDVVGRFEERGAEIYGIGVGLDLSPYYRHSHVLDLAGSVGNAVFRELIAMMARGGRR